MTSRTLRRRLLHHGDVDDDWKKHTQLDFDDDDDDDLNQPLLGTDNSYVNQSQVSTLEEIWDEEERKQRLHWAFLFSHVIAEWAQWLANILLGSGSFIGRLLPFTSVTQGGPIRKIIPPLLSSLQEARLGILRRRLEVPFDGSRLEHQDALKQLWVLAYPDRELPSLKSEQWKEMGWQGCDPSTDFRGGGFISLENLIFFAKTYPEAFQILLHKTDGKRAQWEYPFAVAGINISFMLVQMLDIQSGKPTSLSGVRFIEFLSEDEMAFDHLFCVAFKMMDAQWLAKRASYMEFNEVLKSTRTQLERELALDDVSRVEDLPAYNMLRS